MLRIGASCLIWTLLLGLPGSVGAQHAHGARTSAPSSGLHDADRPPFLNMRAWSVGTGLSAGLLGAEVARRVSPRWGIALGAGAAGVGGRLFVAPLEGPGRIHTWAPYAAAEFAYAPWRWRRLDGAGAAGYSVGAQRWGGDGGWFFDVGAGAAYVREGAWFGRRTLPTVRVAIGRASVY